MRRVATLLSVTGLFALTTLLACRDAEGPQNPSELPGIDTSDLTHRERDDFHKYVSELYAPCADVAVPVAQCVTEKRACPRCVDAAKFLYLRVRDGQTASQITAEYKARFDPAEVKTIPIDGSPTKGPESARVVIVEFADFECPGCGALVPVMDRILDKHPADVRLVYKFFPLVKRHPHAEASARAGIAAMDRGKFWEMHHLLFANQEHLDDPMLEEYAKQLGLGDAKFVTDMRAPETTDRIARDGALVERLGVDHTPTVFVNGRFVDLATSNLEQWVDGELGIAE